ncbi:MAG: MraY family glycosyltransferase [Actinomycetota bacterium]
MSEPLRYLLAFGLTFVGALVLTPFAARLAHRTGTISRPRDDRFHRHATPYLGGLAIAGGLVLTGAITTGIEAQIVTILVAGLALGLLGLLDDVRSVGPIVKLTVEAGAGLALWFAGVRAGFFGVEALDAAVTVLWIVAVSNAINLLDNMDGIAPGVVAISALGFFAIAASEGDYLVGALALGVAGASLGFLRYNFPPAKIFLGDAGSLMIGFLLAALGLKLDLVGPDVVVRAVIPALLLAVPLFDMLLVIVARTRDGRPVYQGGTDHAAHRLSARGFSPRGVALTAFAVQLVCSALAFVLYRASDPIVLAASLVTAAAALVAWSMFLRMEGVVPGLRPTHPEPVHPQAPSAG